MGLPSLVTFMSHALVDQCGTGVHNFIQACGVPMLADLSANTDAAACPTADEPAASANPFSLETVRLGVCAYPRMYWQLLFLQQTPLEPIWCRCTCESGCQSGWIDESAGLEKQCVGHVIIVVQVRVWSLGTHLVQTIATQGVMCDITPCSKNLQIEVAPCSS